MARSEKPSLSQVKLSFEQLFCSETFSDVTLVLKVAAEAAHNPALSNEAESNPADSSTAGTASLGSTAAESSSQDSTTAQSNLAESLTAGSNPQHTPKAENSSPAAIDHKAGLRYALGLIAENSTGTSPTSGCLCKHFVFGANPSSTFTRTTNSVPTTAAPDSAEKSTNTESVAAAAVQHDQEAERVLKPAGAISQHRATQTDCEGPNEPHEVLRTIPAHKLILGNSPYLADLIQAADNNGTKPKVDLLLDSKEDVPAVLAVLGTLYGAETDPELTVDNTLRFYRVADKFGLAQLQQFALQHLIDLAGQLSAAQQEELSSAKAAIATIATNHSEGLATYLADNFEVFEVVAQHLKLQDAVNLWVVHAQPERGELKSAPHSAYMQTRLVKELGDLERVWGEIASSTRPKSDLMELPLPAMQLLLAANDLQVASKDTVLYTAQQYVDNQSDLGSKEAKGKLAPLVRCPHLSRFWLSAAVLSNDAPKMLLSELQPQLRRLLLAQYPHLTDEKVTTAKMQSFFSNVLLEAPASWLLPARTSKTVSSVQFQWLVEVSAIKAAALEAASSKKGMLIFSWVTAGEAGSFAA